jgi:hypothetical protein
MAADCAVWRDLKFDTNVAGEFQLLGQGRVLELHGDLDFARRHNVALGERNLSQGDRDKSDEQKLAEESAEHSIATVAESDASVSGATDPVGIARIVSLPKEIQNVVST